MTETVPLLILGALLCALGILNRKGNISSIHWYQRQRVTEEDIPKYGRLMGNGTLIIGASAIATAILRMLFASEALFLILAAGVPAGIAFMLYAQFKYNGGLF